MTACVGCRRLQHAAGAGAATCKGEGAHDAVGVRQQTVRALRQRGSDRDRAGARVILVTSPHDDGAAVVCDIQAALLQLKRAGFIRGRGRKRAGCLREHGQLLGRKHHVAQACKALECSRLAHTSASGLGELWSSRSGGRVQSTSARDTARGPQSRIG